MKAIGMTLAIGSVLLATSCSSIRSTSSVASIEPNVVSFTVADMVVQPQKVSRTTTWSYNPFDRTTVSTRKTNTEAQLLQENECDVLVEPQYIVNKFGFLRGGSVTVTGYPAKYTNFHKMTPEEAEIIKKAGGMEKKKKAKKRWILF